MRRSLRSLATGWDKCLSGIGLQPAWGFQPDLRTALSPSFPPFSPTCVLLSYLSLASVTHSPPSGRRGARQGGVVEIISHVIDHHPVATRHPSCWQEGKELLLTAEVPVNSSYFSYFLQPTSVLRSYPLHNTFSQASGYPPKNTVVFFKNSVVFWVKHHSVSIKIPQCFDSDTTVFEVRYRSV
jgi:hypothetical protein